MDRIGNDFMQALERLRAGNPRDPLLRARLQKRGVLPINVSTVAKEAGHSRTLIGHRACKYAEVRSLVLAASRTKPNEKSYEKKIRQLQQERDALREQLALSRSVQAAVIRRCVVLETELDRERARRERLQAKEKAEARVVSIER